MVIIVWYIPYRSKNSDIPSRWNFFSLRVPLRGLVQKKNTPTVTSHIPLFLGGVFFEQNVRVFECLFTGGYDIRLS